MGVIIVCVAVGCTEYGEYDCVDLDPTELMTWEDLRELAKNHLLQFIPHSVSHVRFDQLDRYSYKEKEAQLKYEIGKSGEILKEQLGLEQPPVFFCLPGGAGWKSGEEDDPQERLVIKVLQDFGYKGALRAEYKTGEVWNQFCIPRCEPTSIESLKKLLEGEFCCKN